MDSYERLTRKTSAGYMCDADLKTVVQRLGELEDKIEGGELVELPHFNDKYEFEITAKQED